MVGGLTIDVEAGSLRRSKGRPLLWLIDSPLAATEWPEVNWAPLRGYSVLSGRHTWGQCIEFGHAGLANSGHAQHWRTVVLVATGARGAQRFMGYWAACAALARGSRPGEVLLPLVEPVRAGTPALQIVWHRCAAGGCVRSVDARSVVGSLDDGRGRLVLRP